MTEYMIRTQRLYEDDSYLRNFDALVTGCLPAGEVCPQWRKPLTGQAPVPRTPQGRQKPQETAAQEMDTQGICLCGQYAVALDQSAFFPEGGGQYADTGYLYPYQSEGTARPQKAAGAQGSALREPEGTAEPAAQDAGLRVYDVQIAGETVWHRIDRPLPVGTAVRGRIDWEERFSCMQQHSGEHIFSGLTHARFGYDNVGFHLGRQAVTMDFDGPLSEEDILWLQKEANRVITANLPVTVSYPGQEELTRITYRSKKEIPGRLRLVTIEGVDVCACCAPHVALTGEIGMLKVIACKKYKKGVRVSILCGFRALDDYEMKQVQGAQISRLLSAPADEIAGAVMRQQEESAALRQKIYELNLRLIEEKLRSVKEGEETVWFFEEELPAAMMRKAVNAAASRVQRYAGIFCGDDHRGYQYVIAAARQGEGGQTCTAADAKTAAAVLKQAFGARGGGSAEMVQGFIQAPQTQIRECLAKM